MNVNILFKTSHPGPACHHVAVDGLAYPVDLSTVKGGAFADPRIVLVTWDGRDGTINRTSKVVGRFDTEHFADESLLAPYVAVWQAEHDRRAAEAAKQAEIAAEIAKRDAEQQTTVASVTVQG